MRPRWPLVLLFLGVWIGSAAYAPFNIKASERDEVVLEQPANAITIPLANLGITGDTILAGPYQEVKASFSLPAGWMVQLGSFVRLEVEVDFAAMLPNWREGIEEDMDVGVFSIWLNGQIQSNYPISQDGSTTIEFPLDAGAFIQGNEVGLNELVLRWDALQTCEDAIASLVSIHPESSINLLYETQPLANDLALFPYPFVIEKSIASSGVSLVLPPQPGVGELQAALSISAGLGSLSAGELEVELTTIEDLSEKSKAENHLIFIATYIHLDAFPEVVQYERLATSSGDGVVYETRSPWNAGRQLLLVSGENDEALSKAGSAVSSGKLIPSTSADISFIHEIQLPLQVPPPGADITFTELGQEGIRFNEYGNHSMQLPFLIPAGREVSPETYLDLYLEHARPIDYTLSGLWVKLNGVLVGTVRFSDQTAVTHLVRMLLPLSKLRPLYNRLEFEVTIASPSLCPDPAADDHWVNILGKSSLHLPAVQPTTDLNSPFRLEDFPVPFLLAAGMTDSGFVLDRDNLNTWQEASRVMFAVGERSRGRSFLPSVVFQDEVIQSMLDLQQWIVIGLTRDALIPTGWNERLPVPVEDDGSLDIERLNQLGIQLDISKTFGVLEMVSSPAEPQRTAIFILGMDEEGLQQAVNALIEPSEPAQTPRGYFSLVQGGHVVSGEGIANVVKPGVETQVANAIANTRMLQKWTWIGLVATLAVLVLFIIWVVRRRNYYK